MFSFLSEFRDAKRLAGERFHVIFFAENAYYYQYFQHLIEALVRVPNIKIVYITSDKNDPILRNEQLNAVYLKNTLAGIFPRLQADVMIMTMPDLNNFIFKKSASVKKYIYVFHALVSTHQQYRAHAFDHYDAIFCTGPQQEAELKETERLYATNEKTCIPYGYPLLGMLKDKSRSSAKSENKILIAPSWYNEGILNTCILPLVNELSKGDYQIWIRPHPEFIKRNKRVYQQLVGQIEQNNIIHFDTSPSVYTHLLDAEFLITDRSGIALEYALSTYRPVLFIDTPLKIQNTEVSKFSIEPLENVFRSRIGLSILPNELNKVSEGLQKLKSSAEDYRTLIQSVEGDIVFPESHLQKGIDYIQNNLLL